MTYLAEKPSSETEQWTKNPLKVASGVYVTIHGHFYQPPRENPYLNTIERQPSAYPFHDWNERIHDECYRPNAFARVFNDQGEVVGIINNYEYLSFNIGATLMSWLENHDNEVYQRILEADRQSCQRLNGHGNAIAQVYNHIILPLANQRDKYTQIRWGKADFRHRFGRDPEGMWLAETAVDYATLEALIDEGIRFTILAPSQAERCRPLATAADPSPEWLEVGGAQIDPTRPYRCFIPDGRFIDIFFYDGPISRDMGFGEVLSSTDFLAARLGQAIHGDHRPCQILSVATDGETFGHHKKGTEKCLAYGFFEGFARWGWTVTNFAHYLSLCPPTWEVELKPVTAWSCAHGVDRWQDDCGCASEGGQQQKWRKPLRESLNWLRDRLIDIYNEAGNQLFSDPWAAREEYIQVILDRSTANREAFLSRHQNHELSEIEKIDALRLLEMQRHALLMFTSCGWFFEEISRPEGTQILRYAARAIELAAEVTGIHLETEFIHRLAAAPSNESMYSDGGQLYHQQVIPSQISFEQVAAHYAISSLFTQYASQQPVYCYEATQFDYQKHNLGKLTLAVGQVKLVSEITLESHNFVFAVLHLGGWDFHCCVQPYTNKTSYFKLKGELFQALEKASAAQTILAMNQAFGNQSFSLEHLFAEERHRIMNLLTAKTKKQLDQLYTQVYQDNYSILVTFQRDKLPVPQELQVAAEIALSHRCLTTLMALEKGINNGQEMENYLEELGAIATEANYLQCQLNVPEGKTILEKLAWQLLRQLLYESDPDTLEGDIQRLIKLINVAEQLHLGVSLDQVQELYFYCLYSYLVPNCLEKEQCDNDCRWTVSQLCPILNLGQKLSISVSAWLS